MAREIPEPVRAVAGLAATLLDEARKLPATLPALPVRAIGLAMQTTLKLQQEYSGLVARGDEVLTGLRGNSEPGLATFDDDEDDAPAASTGGLGSRTSAFDRVPVDAEDSFDEDFVATLPDDPAADEITSTVDELAVNMSEDAAEDDAMIAASEAAIEAVHEAAAEAPITGYDGFTIAQLRGRLRGYQQVTVEELLAYEQAGQARAPFLTLLRNRLEKITREQS